MDGLLEKDRRRPNLKNRTDERTESAALAQALDYTAHGQVRVTEKLRKHGSFVSPSGVRSTWLGHGLARFRDRLKALERKAAKEAPISTEAQAQALEKKKREDEAIR